MRDPFEIAALKTVLEMFQHRDLSLNEMQVLAEIFSALHAGMRARYSYAIAYEVSDPDALRYQAKMRDQNIALARAHFKRLEGE